MFEVWEMSKSGRMRAKYKNSNHDLSNQSKPHSWDLDFDGVDGRSLFQWHFPLITAVIAKWNFFIMCLNDNDIVYEHWTHRET